MCPRAGVRLSRPLGSLPLLLVSEFRALERQTVSCFSSVAVSEEIHSKKWVRNGRLSSERISLPFSYFGFQIIPSMCTQEKYSVLRNEMRLPRPASTLDSYLQILEGSLHDKYIQSQPSTLTFFRTLKNCLKMISSCAVSSATKILFLLSMGKVLMFFSCWKPNKYL